MRNYSVQNKSGREVSSHLSELIVSFSRSAAEVAVLAVVVNFATPCQFIGCGCDHVEETWILGYAINYHYDKQENLVYLSVDRILTNLRTDPNYLDQNGPKISFFSRIR